jgi:thiol-disulfide isomerase/thioredoxin
VTVTRRRWIASLGLVVALATGVHVAHAEGDVRLISQGREVALEHHLAPGKYVVFDFYADWCAPCRVLTPRLERMVAQRPGRLALRKIDVINWESPVARQHGVSSLPFLVLYGPDGARLASGGAEQVLRVLGRELGSAGGGTAVPAAGGRIPRSVWITLVAAVVIGSVVLRRRARRRPPSSAESASELDEDSTPRIWYVMVHDTLDGPYTVEQLAELSRTGQLTAATRVRRRGDASWLTVGEVLAENR